MTGSGVLCVFWLLCSQIKHTAILPFQSQYSYSNSTAISIVYSVEEFDIVYMSCCEIRNNVQSGYHGIVVSRPDQQCGQHSASAVSKTVSNFTSSHCQRLSVKQCQTSHSQRLSVKELSCQTVSSQMSELHKVHTVRCQHSASAVSQTVSKFTKFTRSKTVSQSAVMSNSVKPNVRTSQSSHSQRLSVKVLSCQTVSSQMSELHKFTQSKSQMCQSK